MDFDGNHLSSMQHALCNVVDYGEVPVGSMMALMTEHEQETEDHLMTSSAVRGTFAYYDHQTEPYLQAALFQAAQAFQIDKVEPQVSGPQFSMEQYDSANVVLADSTLSSGKPEVGGKFVNHQDIGSRKECYTEPSHIISPASSMTVQDARVGATSLDVESACTNKVSEAESMRSKILSHPHYPRLVAAYMNCQKVGAPPEIVAKLEELNKDYQNFQPLRTSIIIGADPELDQFMDAYCHMLQKYHEELTRPFKEAMAFFRKIELQLNNLSKGSLKLPQPGEGDDKVDANASSEEDDAGCGEIEFSDVDPLAEDTKLKEQLLRKYSGYICTLKQEFLKKKKKGKLPKEARQKLLDWWNQHYKWPYPSETEKATLAESTGLDQKQINNWFINQRKRHWKPSEDMQYVMVDSPNGHAAIPFADSNIKMESSNIPMDL